MYVQDTGRPPPSRHNFPREPLDNRDIQAGFPHPAPSIPVRPERSEAESKDAPMPLSRLSRGSLIGFHFRPKGLPSSMPDQGRTQ